MEMTSCVPVAAAMAAYEPEASRPTAASPPRRVIDGTIAPADSWPNETVAVVTVDKFRAKNKPTADMLAVLIATVPAAFVPGVSVCVLTPLLLQLAVTPEATKDELSAPRDNDALIE
jgi:hypothetical protein